MNHFNSPLPQTNEAAGKYTPQQDDLDRKPSADASKYLLLAGTDLEKITKRSNHSNHQSSYLKQQGDDQDDAMDDFEDFISGLMYPGLEESSEGDEESSMDIDVSDHQQRQYHHFVQQQHQQLQQYNDDRHHNMLSAETNQAPMSYHDPSRAYARGSLWGNQPPITKHTSPFGGPPRFG